MQAWKKTVLSFLVGGALALIAQAILVCWQQTPVTETPFIGNFSGGITLISMGIIGCLLGGFALYQLLGEWADFGSFLPFSGFAMAIGMKSINPWTKGKSVWECLRPALWMVLWFNFVGAVICILFGYICQVTGLNANPIFVSERNTTGMVFPAAFLMGGILCAFFQICWEIWKKILGKKAQHWHILMFAWCCGAILAPCGFSTLLANVFGEGFSVMIPVGGYNMYNVGVDFALGGEEFMIGIEHLCSFLIAVCGLAVCCMLTFALYNFNFGRKPITEVHAEMGKKLYERKSAPGAGDHH
ncbi:MAG: SpoVA/SpoVAEb family sporulation membrane protein [Coriobacteriia bacterium]|nr:SpoVA/SpoVAEb family sporulation membrane protein [Coriobacteriia bacterium]